MGQRVEPIEQRSADLLYSREGEMELGLDAGHADHAQVGGGLAGAIEERAQPDSRVASEDKRTALAPTHIREQTIDGLELLLPPEQHQPETTPLEMGICPGEHEVPKIPAKLENEA
jgi:hypothetical protein